MSAFQFLPASPLTLEPCHQGQTIAFIDAGLVDYWSLVEGLTNDTEALVLHAHSDGIEQITGTILTNTRLDSIHIFAEGAPGCLKLGNTVLSLETLDYYAQDLQIWFLLSQLCDRHPSLHLYGSHVAASPRGQAFIRRLHYLTGAGISASTSPTGNREAGGNWKLEATVGPVLRHNILKPETMVNYRGTL